MSSPDQVPPPPAGGGGVSTSRDEHLLKVRAGDVLLLTTAQALPDEHLTRLRDTLAGQLPGIKVVIADGIDCVTVCRPSTDEEAA